MIYCIVAVKYSAVMSKLYSVLVYRKYRSTLILTEMIN